MNNVTRSNAVAARWPNGPRVPTCHPDQKHVAHGLCVRCYAGAQRRRRSVEDPDWQAKRRRYGKAFIARNPAKPRRDWLKLAYGVAPEDVVDMAERQNGRCGICGADDVRLTVDHDHATGQIRGLLCHHCNVGIGFFRDDPARLLEAIAYLTRGRTGEV